MEIRELSRPRSSSEQTLTPCGGNKEKMHNRMHACMNSVACQTLISENFHLAHRKACLEGLFICSMPHQSDSFSKHNGQPRHRSAHSAAEISKEKNVMRNSLGRADFALRTAGT